MHRLIIHASGMTVASFVMILFIFTILLNMTRCCLVILHGFKALVILHRTTSFCSLSLSSYLLLSLTPSHSLPFPLFLSSSFIISSLISSSLLISSFLPPSLSVLPSSLFLLLYLCPSPPSLFFHLSASSLFLSLCIGWMDC